MARIVIFRNIHGKLHNLSISFVNIIEQIVVSLKHLTKIWQLKTYRPNNKISIGTYRTNLGKTQI